MSTEAEPGRRVAPRVTITLPDTDAGTARARAAAEAAESTSRAAPITTPSYRDLMAGSPLAFALLNASGDMVEVNRSFAELLDSTIARLRVMGLHQITHPADHDVLDDALEALVDGPERALSAYLRLVDYSGQSIQVVAHLSATGQEENTSILVAAVDLSGQTDRMTDLAYAATHDHLTGLFNRAGLLAQLHALLHDGRSASLALLDLDRLKPINDEYGHAMGDHLLRRIGHALHEMTSPDGVAGRLAGDEFVVIADTTDEIKLGRFLAAELERLQVEVAPGVVITPTASIGTSAIRIGMTPSQVLALADDSMYAEKRRRQEALSAT
jgi:diguanylate cyclase (GGDEF)-like protein/PAS domain S-box-containing protein